jgi:hypothetical protein
MLNSVHLQAPMAVSWRFDPLNPVIWRCFSIHISDCPVMLQSRVLAYIQVVRLYPLSNCFPNALDCWLVHCRARFCSVYLEIKMYILFCSHNSVLQFIYRTKNFEGFLSGSKDGSQVCVFPFSFSFLYKCTLR